MDTNIIDSKLKERASNRLNKDIEEAFRSVKSFIKDHETLKNINAIKDNVYKQLIPEYEKQEVEQFFNTIFKQEEKKDEYRDKLKDILKDVYTKP